MEEKIITKFNIDELKTVLFKLKSIDNDFIEKAFNNKDAFKQTISAISNQLEAVLNQLDT